MKFLLSFLPTLLLGVSASSAHGPTYGTQIGVPVPVPLRGHRRRLPRNVSDPPRGDGDHPYKYTCVKCTEPFETYGNPHTLGNIIMKDDGTEEFTCEKCLYHQMVPCGSQSYTYTCVKCKEESSTNGNPGDLGILVDVYRCTGCEDTGSKDTKDGKCPKGNCWGDWRDDTILCNSCDYTTFACERDGSWKPYEQPRVSVQIGLLRDRVLRQTVDMRSKTHVSFEVTINGHEFDIKCDRAGNLTQVGKAGRGDGFVRHIRVYCEKCKGSGKVAKSGLFSMFSSGTEPCGDCGGIGATQCQRRRRRLPNKRVMERLSRAEEKFSQ